ncbi:unnamed protein product [Cylindrotheca closterium]|uniref:EF-hand domain-containing protein n=1 Tax=Cylindrotheca closterium TaxID=2856 RepID=A0AAD2PY24_9STRA|nr:unnamed protein product [Cylindrotheca closterium]
MNDNDTSVVAVVEETVEDEVTSSQDDTSMMRNEILFKVLFYTSAVSFVLLFFRLIYQIVKKITSGKNGNLLTNSKPFKMMVSSTFKSMDNTGNGEVTKDELYAGLLLIHLKLSKFVGAPACYPPIKTTCDGMFEAADHDNSGGIDEEEFSSIMAVCCGQIMSRMVVYYLIVILGVPYTAAKVVDILPIENGSHWETVTETIVGFAIFSLAIPLVWNFIDEASRKKLVKKEDKPAAPTKSNGVPQEVTPKKKN